MTVGDYAKSPSAVLLPPSFEQSLLSTDSDNGETAVSLDELFTCFIGAPTDSYSHSGLHRKESYQCRCCGKHFGRLDHVKRHCRSHANERTYSCKSCTKSFNRKDLRDRHSATHNPVSYPAEHRIKHRSRTTKACAQCILSKTKCSDDRPCCRCQDRGQTCGPKPEVSPALLPGSSMRSTSGISALSPVVSSQATLVPHGTNNEPLDFIGSHSQLQLGDRDGDRAFDALQPSMVGTRRSAEYQAAKSPGISSLWNSNLLSYDSAFSVDDDILMAMDLDWNSLIQPDYDLIYEDSSNMPPGPPNGSDGLHSASRSRTLLIQEFFKRTLWLWDSDSRDSAAMEQSPHLSEAEERNLLSSMVIEKALEDRTATSLVLAGLACGREARDSLLTLVMRNSDCTATIGSFPSPEVLSFLLKTFAVHESVSRCPFLHLSSFKVDKAGIELLGALVVASSALFADPHIWKLGLALQDRTRLALYKVLNQKHSTAWGLDYLRAQTLWIEAGLWSGCRRRMEDAEGAANSVPTMLRRAGAFHVGYYAQCPAPMPEDNGETLESKWVEWIELESFKRCVFRAFINDIQGSVAYMRSPCFNCTAITFGLPAAHDLWTAPDPNAWKTRFLAKMTAAESPRPTLLDIVQDPSVLQSLASAYDGQLSAFAALHCLWPQLVALQEAKMLFRRQSYTKQHPQNNFWLEAQRQDLYKRLADIRDISDGLGILADEAQMVGELFMMALFVSFADIEKVVGRFGVEESRSAIPSLQVWSKSDESRYALWHAGQILKAAHNFKATQLRGFYAIAVYQACLVLALPVLLEAVLPVASAMIPGLLNDVLSTSRQPQQPISITQQVNLIVLNGQENMQSKSFLLTGQGTPALLVGDDIKKLSEIEIMPTMIARVFEENHKIAIPPMMERLVDLVRELTKSTVR